MNVRHNLSENQYLVAYDVGPSQGGMRLDAFLKHHYRRRSREALKKAIAGGHILIKREQGPHVTTGKLKPSLQLLAGDEVHVVSDKKPEPPVCFDYRIIYQDDALFVIEKPANLPVHPSGRYFFNTLLTHLRTEGHRNPLRENLDYYLVHRIDKETSGILVLAKTKEACADLTKQFADRKTRKRYIAICRGITPEEFEVEEAMRRSTTSVVALKMEICSEDAEGAQTALTGFKRLQPVINSRGSFSIVECFPKTGRQHQIRLHLAHAGYPIVGDKLYSLPDNEAVNFYDRKYLSPELEAKLLLPRHALHAAGIAFTHPTTGEPMSFECDLPQDLREFLNPPLTAVRAAPQDQLHWIGP